MSSIAPERPSAFGPIPAAVIVASLALIMTQGHDGLSMTLGAVGAAYLATTVFTAEPGMVGGASGWSETLTRRSGSQAVGRAVSAVAVLALTGLLAAELAAIILALRMIEAPINQLAAILPAVLVFAAVAARRSSIGVAGLVLAVAVGCGVAATIAVASVSAGDGIGGFISMPTLARMASLEQSLLEKRLADPATFKPFGVPFLRSDALNFLSLTATFSIGLALLLPPSGADRRARTGWLVATMVALSLLPPLAALLKSALLAAVDTGLRVTALPEWIVAGTRTATIEVCRSTGSGDAAALAKACGKGFGPQGLLKWQDIAIVPDAIPFVAMAAAGLPLWLSVALSAAVVVVGSWTAARCLGLVVQTLTAATGLVRDGAGVTIGTAMVVLLAASIAVFETADIATLVTTAAAITFAGLGPVAMAALGSRPVPARAALVAIVLGAMTALVTTTAPRIAPMATFNLSGSSAVAPPSVVRKLASLQETIATLADGPGRVALRAQADRLARDNTSWLGLKPAASGLLGMVLGALTLLVGAGLSRLRRET